MVYNAALAAGWGFVLFLTYKTVLLEKGGSEDVWKVVELPLKISQTAAVMEVVHSAIGLVRSPLGITATQVASRIWCLWLIIVPCLPTTVSGSIPVIPGVFSLNLISLLTAWCISEVIRYGFFALKEAGFTPYFATWLRYSGFIVLYPIGVASELTMAWLALPIIKATDLWSINMPNAWNFGFSYYVVCLIVMATYIPGLPQLYGYMLTQRKKILGSGAKAKVA